MFNGRRGGGGILVYKGIGFDSDLGIICENANDLADLGLCETIRV